MLKYLQNKLQYLIEFSTQFASYDRSFYGLSMEWDFFSFIGLKKDIVVEL